MQNDAKFMEPEYQKRSLDYSTISTMNNVTFQNEYEDKKSRNLFSHNSFLHNLDVPRPHSAHPCMSSHISSQPYYLLPPSQNNDQRRSSIGSCQTFANDLQNSEQTHEQMNLKEKINLKPSNRRRHQNDEENGEWQDIVQQLAVS